MEVGFFPINIYFFKECCVLHISWNWVFIEKINKAVALQYFNTKPYITSTEPLYCRITIAVSTLIILWYYCCKIIVIITGVPCCMEVNVQWSQVVLHRTQPSASGPAPSTLPALWRCEACIHALEWSWSSFDPTICPKSWRRLVQIRSEIGWCWVLSHTSMFVKCACHGILRMRRRHHWSKAFCIANGTVHISAPCNRTGMICTLYRRNLVSRVMLEHHMFWLSAFIHSCAIEMRLFISGSLLTVLCTVKPR